MIGLGYIGLPTAVAFARSGWEVTGVDVNRSVVDSVNLGRLPFEEPGLEDALRSVLADGSFRASTKVPRSSVYVVAVPTPFREGNVADLRYIEDAARAVGEVASSGELVVLESTSPPGTTEQMVRWTAEASPTGAEGVLFAHAPERVLPGRILVELAENDRIVGGTTESAGLRAQEVYQTFCEGQVRVTDAVTAELSKLAENAFRDVNIAFANELSIVCDQLGVDVWELIELANAHPRVNILQPGPGVGGHCIAVDPWFIVQSAPASTDLIRAARKVNDGKPAWVLEKVRNALLEAPGSNVGVFGLSFKPNVDDLRESPALEIASALAREFPETRVNIVEPNIRELPLTLEAENNTELVQLSDALTSSDIAVLLVDHEEFLEVQADDLTGKVVIDTRGRWKS